MGYDASEFYYFAKDLRIDSKERGLISLGENFNGAQRTYLEEIQKGFEAGQHEFIVLKCRQIGLSTASLALDLYWINKHVGLNAALVTHDEESRESFRTTLALYRTTLGDHWQREVLDDNRTQLVLENGSRLRMLVAGTRRKGGGSSKLGRSGALVECHATEAAFWGDASGIDSLKSSFAQHNPDRFFVWESTANGVSNHYYDMWQEAQHATSIRPIFISWWANELYSAARDSPIYQAYWGPKGRLTPEERAITKQVKRSYDWAIDDMSWAWYRFMAAERITDEMQLAQEFPHLPEHAFVATGQAFFRALSITEAQRQCKAQGKPACLRIDTGSEFWQLRVNECREPVATLKVWKEPVAGAFYVLGCDPAYASSEDANNNAISIWRCWYNRIEQVAEFADNAMSPHAVGWVVAYLAGHYGMTTVNLEINGPGINVLQSLKELQRQSGSRFEADRSKAIREVVSKIRHYVFRKPDTFNGMLQAWHTKTTFDVKERMLNGLRDFFERDLLRVRSLDLVDEMRGLVREGGSAPAAPDGKNDDRVIAASLAVMAWSDQMRQQLLTQGVIWRPEDETRETDTAPPRSVADRLVQNYFVRLGIRPSDAPPPSARSGYAGKRSSKTREKPMIPGVEMHLPSVRGWR